MASISLTAHSQTSKDTGVGSHVSCEDLTSFSEVLQMFLLTEFLSTRRSVVENSGLKITVIICLLNCNVRFQNLTLKKVQVGVCFLFPWIPYVLFPPKFMLTFANLFLYFSAFWFETRSHSIVQDGLELKAILLCQLPKCWN